MSQTRLKYAVAMVLVLSVVGAALAARRPAAPKADAGPPPSAGATTADPGPSPSARASTSLRLTFTPNWPPRRATSSIRRKASRPPWR